jgi:8-oxo-dGTP diphosphatase
MILKNISLDCVIFGFIENKLNVLLWQSEIEQIKKFFAEEDNFEEVKILFEKNPIHKTKGYWGLIGTHLPSDENLDDYAKQILAKSTGLTNVFLRQIKTFGDVKRVPHYRVLTIGYYALINPEYHDLQQSEMAKVLSWHPVHKLPKLTFDHKSIIKAALNKLRDEVKYHPIGFHMLPEKFTLTELQNLYEAILGISLDTRNFRKKIQNMGLLVDTKEKQTHVAHRAAKLYTFDVDIYNKLKEDGLHFRIGQ